jgi:hypothetical protein
MELFLHSRPVRPNASGGGLASQLFTVLETTYTSTSQLDDMSILQWIMPSSSTISVTSEQLVSMKGGKKEDDYYLRADVKWKDTNPKMIW